MGGKDQNAEVGNRTGGESIGKLRLWKGQLGIQIVRERRKTDLWGREGVSRHKSGPDDKRVREGLHARKQGLQGDPLSASKKISLVALHCDYKSSGRC